MVTKKTKKIHKTTGARRKNIQSYSKKTVSRKTAGKAAPRRRTARRSNGFGKRVKALFFWGFKWCFVAGLWLVFMLMGVLAYLAADLPDIQSAVDFDNRPTVILLAANGDEIARYGDLQGEIVETGRISPNLIHAVISIEDRRFYYHFGIDPLGLLRATAANIRAGHVVQGGSTLTQQLAKMLFLTPERTLTRKAKEALLALYLEYRYSKDEILMAYLNRAYFGAGAYGIDAASRIYFKKSPADLTVEEAALIAGLLRAPSKYSPANNPELAAQRAQIVLGAMADAGYITLDEATKEVTPLPAKEYARAGAGDMRYFGDWVMEQLSAYVGSINQDLIVQTTLIPDLQKAAGDRVRDYIDTNREEWNLSQAALVSMEKDGAVRVLIGGRDYQESQFNRATEARRQPGSSFKPFVYLTALQNGYSPLTMVEDKPIEYNDYAPKNYKGEYKGFVTLGQAMAYSLNTIAVQLAYEIGVPKVIETARRMGITADLNPDLSMALGTSEMSLLSLATAYIPFANGGYSVQPYGITEIRTQTGKLIYRRPVFEPLRVIDPQSLYGINIMLQGVVEHGSGRAAGLGRAAGGKTGTTQGFKDAWFMGYTADYITGVWMGNDDNTPMNGVTGGLMPARIWHDYMVVAEQGLPPTELLGSDVVNDYFENNDYAKNDWNGKARLLPDIRQLVSPGAEPIPEVEDAIQQHENNQGSGFWGLLGRLTGSEEEDADIRHEYPEGR